MSSDEKAFQEAVRKCQKAFRGIPLRVVLGVLEQLLVEALSQVPFVPRPQAMQVLFDAIRNRVLPPAVVPASNLDHKGGAVGGPKLIVSPTRPGSLTGKASH